VISDNFGSGEAIGSSVGVGIASSRNVSAVEIGVGSAIELEAGGSAACRRPFMTERSRSRILRTDE
jgi:hypothetical protein